MDKTSYEREISETSIPMKITIKPNNIDLANRIWNEGYLLVKLPKEIIDVKNMSIQTFNTVISSDVLEINGQKFIKVLTSTKENRNYTIDINIDAVVDPKGATTSTKVELYAINKNATLYRNSTNDVYDLDEDGNTTEKIAYSNYSFNLTTPSELLTGSIIKNYDDTGSQIVSPLVADINPLSGDNDANVEVFLVNNSRNKIKNIVVIGKVAYRGNTYQIGTGDLGSEYDVEMSGPIEVPSTLEGKVKIYYSENKTPTNDIEDSNNGWTTNPDDYTKIKTYLIKIDESFVMNVSDEYSFTYPINLPNTTQNLLKTTYFTHGAYFDYITDSGSYSSEVSGAKLGVRMARKYDLKINTYKKYTDTLITSGLYVLTDEDGNTKTLSVNSDGIATANDLYVDKEYKLKQYQLPSSLILDKEEKVFKVSNEDDDLLILTNKGTYRNIEYDDVNVLNVDLENEILYTLDLYNIDAITDDSIKNSVFKITGVNHEDGTNIITGANGHAYLKNLVIGEIYNVEQVRADGYAVVESFNIKLIRDNDTNNIKIAVEKVPELKVGDDCDTLFTYTSTGLNTTNLSSERKYPATEGDYKCNLILDLSEYNDNYSLSGTAAIYDYMSLSSNSSLKISLVKDLTNTLATPFKTVTRTTTKNYWTWVTQSFTQTTAVEKNGNSYTSIPLKGGGVYNLYVLYHRGNNPGTNDTYTPYTYINFNKIQSQEHSIEYVPTNITENINPKDNYSVYQTIYNYNVTDTDIPVLKVTVANKYMDKFNFEVNKVDGDTLESLKGAQFKITGPGLPVSGRYLTTDENGKASLELYLSYTGNFNLIPGLSSDKYPKNNVYTIEEVHAPEGYTIDNKPVSFKGNGNIIDDETINYSLMYTSDSKFVSYELDEDTNTFKVVMKDYPVVKITKKDEETGEILPNTYYVINEIGEDDLLTPAKDVNGEYVGEKLIIDGKEYYVIKTNSEGSISLNLSSGKYQLKEIQAADEKYEISDQVIMFGVGETIPYKAAGADLVGGFIVDALNSSNYSFVYRTNDGGYMVVNTTNNGTAKKYDKDFNLVWQKSLVYGRDRAEYYIYFDDPDRVETRNYYQEQASGYGAIVFTEEDDGYYFGSSTKNMIKLNKEDGSTIFNGNKFLSYYSILKFNKLCKLKEGASYPSYYTKDGVDGYYYCSDDQYYVNNFVDGTAIFDTTSDEIVYLEDSWGEVSSGESTYEDGDERITYTKNYYNNSVRLANGEFVTSNFNGREYYIIRTDLDGNIISATPIAANLTNAVKEYYEKAGGSLSDNYTFRLLNEYRTIKVLSDRSVIIVGRLESGDSFSSRIDKDGNVLYFLILGYQGNPISLETYGTDKLPPVYIDEEGNVFVALRDSKVYGSDSNLSNDHLRNTELHDINLPTEKAYPNGYNAYAIFKINPDGKFENVTEVARGIRTPESPYESNDLKRVYNFDGYYKFVRVDDGYIIAAKNYFKNSSYTPDEYRTVELASGETIKINNDTELIVYKVNDDSSVEWVKQYNNFNSIQTSLTPILLYNEEEFTFIFSTNDKTISEYGNDDIPEIVKGNNPGNLMVLNFKLSDEVTPVGPEAFVLDLRNKRKKYNINVTSNEGGNFEISNPDGTSIYVGNNPGTVETVKHGDNTENIIKVIPNDGYTVTDVTVNGSQATFTVDNEGNIVIDQFKNVTEEKNIVVTFKLGVSKVIVHHYLYGTTTKISSDEILTGDIGSSYTTIPKTSKLYSLNKDSNDEYILPDNYIGKFTSNPIEVIYYYNINKVDLIVNYKEEDTDITLADSLLESYDLFTEYVTKAINIKYYKVSSVIGNESGVLEDEETEVTYLYSKLDMSNLIVKYIDSDTKEDLVDPIEKEIEIDSYYETEELKDVPVGYRLSSKTDNYKGLAQDENIEVIYYYDRIKSKITARYIDFKTQKDIADNIEIEVNLGEKYITSELENIPDGYKLREIPSNASGIANSEKIEVLYYYEKLNNISNSNKDVKGASEVPKTLDNIIKYVILFCISIIGLLGFVKIKKGLKN